MALVPGTRLGVYEIVGLIGAGGMGEVYKGTDTRLNRTVAIKVLTTQLAGAPQFLERFDREAKVISQLDHPHICTLYDVGEQNGTAFLIMQYLDGETLANRLASGPLPLQLALKIAIELADALDKAHRAGVVHRDLKPGNVMLTKSGAKLLDFGLAKSTAPAVQTPALSMLPTTPPNLTAQGTILGTLQYMAPEQIEGLDADARTDVFAFGALLFEMLTGRTAFEGRTRASLLGAILKDDPPLVSHVQPLAPAALDRIVSTCLAKDPDDRYQSMRDLLRDLEWAASGSADVVMPAPGALRSSRIAWLVAAAAALVSIATTTMMLRGREVAVPGAPVQFTIAAPEKMSFGGPSAGGTGTATQLAVSPDGRNVVFVAGVEAAFQIWLRPIGARGATPIPGTEGGAFPFWSPDSRFIGFFADGKLKKVGIGGGPAIPLCDAPSGRGGSWSRDNVIVFAPSSTTEGGGLMRVSGAGGVPALVTTVNPPAPETSHRWPHFLPDGRHFLYTETTGACCPPPRPAVIKIGSLDDAAATVTLFEAESSVSYASGHLLFSRNETLMAQPFDPRTRQLTADAFPLADRVGPEGSRYVGVSAAADGTLVYAQDGAQAQQQLTWFDRSGRVLATVGERQVPYTVGPGGGRRVALSPDGTHAALAMAGGSSENQDIWIIDLSRNGISSRLTVDPEPDRSPVWSPDGTRIAFAAERSGRSSIRQTFVNKPGSDELLLETATDALPTDWSSDGRFIAYTLTRSFPARSDVWVAPMFGDRKPFAVAETSAFESSGAFSRDGRWIAYTSDEAARRNVYVQPFPAGGVKYPVSSGGGAQPVWAPDGSELFFLGPDGMMMAAKLEATERFGIGIPQPLFPAISPSSLIRAADQFAVTKDGQRFLVHARPPQAAVTPITIVINWLSTIQR